MKEEATSRFTVAAVTDQRPTVSVSWWGTSAQLPEHSPWPRRGADLRVDDPLVANRRVTTREVEIQGRTIPKGEPLTLMWIAANRDPRAFDDPNAVKIERSRDAGLVWGQGIHLCLGASLARLQMRVALEELLSRTKRVEIIGAPPRRAVYPSNGPAALLLQVS